MSRTQEVFWGSTWYFIGAMLAAGVAYLTKLVLVRTLTVEEFGLFFAVFTFVLFFTIFRSIGLNQGLARFIAEYSLTKRFSQIKSLIVGSALLQLIVSSLIVIILWSLAPWLAENYFGSPKAVLLLRLMALYLPLMILVSNTRAALQGFKITYWYSFSEFASNLFVLILVGLALIIGLGMYSAAIGYLGSIIIFYIIFGSVVNKKTKILSYKQKDFFSENKKLVLFSLPLVLTGAGAVIISYFDTLMLTYFDTLANVGVYNIIYPSAMILALVGSSIGTILLPVVTQMWTSKKKKEIGKALETIYTYIFASSLIVVVILAIFSEELLGLFFGSEYAVGATAFSVLLIAAILSTIITVNNQILVAIKKPRQTMRVYVVGSVANIILNVALIPSYSLLGAALATIISFLIMVLMSLYYVREGIPINIPVKKILLCFVSVATIPFIISQTMILLNIHIYASAIISSVVAATVYFLLLMLLKVINVQEVLSMYKK